MNKLTKDGKELLYIVEEKKIKHSYIKPKNGYVLITKSTKMSLDLIIKRIKENFNYYYDLTSKKNNEDDKLFLWGNPYNLIINYGKSFNYKINEFDIIVNYHNNDYFKIKQLILAEELKDFLLTIKNEVSNTLIKEGYYEVPIKLKLLKSKYGSYNYAKENEYIVLNTFLATLEEEFAYYVLYHEYAHQREKNHQRPFYEALAKLYPEHRKYNNKLKKIRLDI